MPRFAPIGFVKALGIKKTLGWGFLVGVSAVLWSLSLDLVGDFQVDDAYITFAFSKNLAQGHGPIYGHDMRVEGYSNFLWMVLVALGMIFGLEPLVVARILGHVACAGLLWATYRGARVLSGSIPAALAVLVIAATSDLTRAAQSGLETAAYSAFVAASLSEYLTEPRQARKRSMIWAALAALTRIDGFVPLFTLAGLEGARLVLSSRSLPRNYFRWLLWGCLPVLGYWLWRWAYYGLPLPLPYYAKASQTISGASSGLAYLESGARDLGLWIPILLVCLGMPRPLDRRTAVLLGTVIIGSAYVAYVGGDWMPMHRMLLPLLAPLWMLASLGIDVLWNRIARGRMGRVAARLAALAVVTLAGKYVSEISVDTGEERRKISHAAELTRHTHGLLQALPFIQATQRRPGERLVTDYGGVFALGTEASVIEMWGLCNRDIALKGNSDGINPIYGKTCIPCYPALKPDYFHVNVPMLRAPGSVTSVRAALSQIFQGHALDRVLSLRKRFTLGQVTREATGETLYFIERRRDELSYEPRRVDDLIVSYPSVEGD